MHVVLLFSGDEYKDNQSRFFGVIGGRKSVVELALVIAVLAMLSACTDSDPADGTAMHAGSPALMPAPTRTEVPAPTTAVQDIVRPPTGTPTAQSGSLTGQAASNQVPTATPSSLATVGAMPLTAQAPRAMPEAVALDSDVDCAAELEIYRGLLTTGATLSPFQVPVIATCLADAGDMTTAIAICQEALRGDLDRLSEVTIRQSLGELLLEAGEHDAALAQFDSILEVAETDVSRSRAMYQAAQAALKAGNIESGYGRLFALINEYPEASQSYAALADLLAAGYAIDDGQQGRIAFAAGDYHVSAAAFSRAIEADPEESIETYLNLAKSQERLGNVDGALTTLDSFIATREDLPEGGGVRSVDAGHGRIERARLNDRADRAQAALDDYQTYLDLYPDGVDAPAATWQLASLNEAMDIPSLASDRYLTFAQNYPQHADAAEALFRAAYLSMEMDETAQAQAIWRRAVQTYPERDYGAASLLWLLKTLPVSERSDFEVMALNGNGFGYYAPRAAHLANGVQPFATTGATNLNLGDTGRDFAESWLRQWLGLANDAPVAALSGDVAADPRLAWAEELWSSGFRGEAARQYEILRAAYSGDALANYQLALYFRDLGLHKLSILAVLSLMEMAGVGATGAPRFIARLAYPVYYGDSVAAEAERYGYDPLLQLALIREESYFDTTATSPLGARGLSQILPETGASIAAQLGWPGYSATTLYQPDAAISFGGHFFDQLLSRYDGHVAAALAAYNAGPGFADDWVQLEANDFDRFLETIDFPETQRFVKQIYITHSIYRFLYS